MNDLTINPYIITVLCNNHENGVNNQKYKHHGQIFNEPIVSTLGKVLGRLAESAYRHPCGQASSVLRTHHKLAFFQTRGGLISDATNGQLTAL